MTSFIDRDFYADKAGTELPAGALGDRTIEHASGVIADAVRNDLFAVGPDGLPLDDLQKHAIKWATVMHAYAMIEAGVDPLAGATGVIEDGTMAGAGLGSASYSLSVTGSQQLASAKMGLLTDAVPTAIRVLKRAGLASITIGT